MNRLGRAKLGRETVEIIERGDYTTPGGMTVDLRASLAQMKEDTRLYRPQDFPAVTAQTRELMAVGEKFATRFEVHNETTLAAARRLAAESPAPVLALNFASAKNPGGGFLGGAVAQEESLARSSGLYGSLRKQPGYYEANRGCGTALYTDHMIYSPGVPVFRDDEGNLLEEPYTVTFLTVPAVNAGAVRKNHPQEVSQILPVMEARTARLLALAALHRHDTLVLGAWGCGVFKNDPVQIARLLAEPLRGPLAGAFRRVAFAVLDREEPGKIIGAFREAFG